jgi:basic amino acid/polyamine antiporter, APA family
MKNQALATPTPALRRTLRGRDYFTLAFGSMVGVGWMLVIDDWLMRGGSGGAMLGFLIGGLLLAPIGYAYGRLTEQMPDAGSEIAYTDAVFPKWAAFGTGWAMTLAYLIVCPYEAVAIGRVASYVFPQMNTFEMYRVGGYPVYLPHLVAGLLLTAIIVTVNYRGVQLSARFQNFMTFGLLAIFAVFATLGFWRGQAENLQPFFAGTGGTAASNTSGTSVMSEGFISTLLVLQIVPYFMTGFEAVPKCSEEASADFSPRHFKRVIFIALGAGIFFYVTVIAVVSLIQPWQTLTGERFATAVAFERAFGSRLLVQLIMLGVLLSLLKIFNGNFLTATRLLFAMGRRDLLDKRLSQVHPRFRAPAVAVAFAGVLTAAASFLGQAVLVPISEVGSLASAVGWLATCLALCAGAAKGLTPRAKMIGVAGVAVATMLILIKLLPWVPGSFRSYEFIALAGWIALGALLWRRRV